MNDTQRMIKNAVGIEYTNAITPDEKLHKGRFFNTLHEGYAVLLEELEEANEAYIPIEEKGNTLFHYIRNNDIDIVKEMLEEKVEHCQNAMAELAQVAAVCKKMRDTIEMYYEDCEL